MKISHIISISKILAELCEVIRQNVGLKNTFPNIVYNISVMKSSWKNTKKIV